MTDIHDKATRSFNMSQIKSKNTKPELLVRKFLFSKGFRYNLYDKGLPGKPDIILVKLKTVIFIHGCFWHGHKNCKYFVVPKTRTDWWLKKIERNRLKDKDSEVKLLTEGWHIITIFECELKKNNLCHRLDRLLSELEDIRNLITIGC